MQVAILFLCVALSGVSARHIMYFDHYCVGIPNSYCVWDDPYNYLLWFLDDFAHWGADCYLPPYVSYAESTAMAATFTLRFVGKELGLGYNTLEYISAAHILLDLHKQQAFPDFFSCNEPNMWGSLAGFFLESPYLYNDMDIYFGMNPKAWCDFAYYEYRMQHLLGMPVYNYAFVEFPDGNVTFAELRDEFMYFGVHLGTIPYCPEIMAGTTYYPNDKYTCDPNTPGAMWGTVVYFGVREDTDGIWYATYFMEATSNVNRLQWTRPSLKSDWYAIVNFNYVWNRASSFGY